MDGNKNINSVASIVWYPEIDNRKTYTSLYLQKNTAEHRFSGDLYPHNRENPSVMRNLSSLCESLSTTNDVTYVDLDIQLL